MLWLFLISAGVFASLLANELRRRYRYRHVELPEATPAVRLAGRVVGPGRPGRCVCGEQAASDAFEVEAHGRRHRVAAGGAVLDVGLGRWRMEIRVGDQIVIDGLLTWRPRAESLYRQPSREVVVEAVRIVRGAGGGRPWLLAPALVAGLVAAVSLAQVLWPRSLAERTAGALRCPEGGKVVTSLIFPAGWINVCQVNERRQGPSQRHDASGVLREEGSYHEGRRDGVWIERYAFGVKESEGSFRHGLRHGQWREWYGSGRPRLVGHYRDGVKHGWWTEWDDAGRRTLHGEHWRARRHGAWSRWRFTARGEEHRVTSYWHGQRDGLDTRYEADGGRLACGFRRGLLEGWCRRWNAKGQLMVQGEYRAGKSEGWHSLWSKGQLVGEDRFRGGEGAGQWRAEAGVGEADRVVLRRFVDDHLAEMDSCIVQGSRDPIRELDLVLRPPATVRLEWTSIDARLLRRCLGEAVRRRGELWLTGSEAVRIHYTLQRDRQG